MIRQAHTYLVGAMGGATLIALAIAGFRHARFGPGLPGLADRRARCGGDEAAAVSGGRTAAVGRPAGGAGSALEPAAMRPALAAATERQQAAERGRDAARSPRRRR